MPAGLSSGRIGTMFACPHDLPAVPALDGVHRNAELISFPGVYTVRKNSRSLEVAHAQCYFAPPPNGALLNRTTGSSMVTANDSQVTWRSAMGRLTSTADLRRVISEPRAATRAKILDALDEQSIDFLKRCPFALVGTTAEGVALQEVDGLLVERVQDLGARHRTRLGDDATEVGGRGQAGHGAPWGSLRIVRSHHRRSGGAVQLRQFPQFPLAFSSLIRRQHETTLRVRGLRRPGILAHRIEAGNGRQLCFSVLGHRAMTLQADQRGERT